MSQIKIEKNVPFPSRIELPPLPLEQMQVSDSFMIECGLGKEVNALRQRLQRFQRNNPPKRFSVRRVDDERVRVFRREDFTRRDMLRKVL